MSTPIHRTNPECALCAGTGPGPCRCPDRDDVVDAIEKLLPSLRDEVAIRLGLRAQGDALRAQLLAMAGDDSRDRLIVAIARTWPFLPRCTAERPDDGAELGHEFRPPKAARQWCAWCGLCLG